MSQTLSDDSEIKPCPFCNLDFNQAPMYTLPTIEKDFIHNCMGGLILKHPDWRIGKLLWQNAYCWKELSQQREKYEFEIESQKHCYKLLNEYCESLRQENQELKNKIEIMSIRCKEHERALIETTKFRNAYRQTAVDYCDPGEACLEDKQLEKFIDEQAFNLMRGDK